jgi:hypothetical protein
MKILTWFTLLAYLLIAAGDVEETVLCFEADGHVRIELAQDWICSEDLPDRLQNASHPLGDLTLPQSPRVDCCPCRDIPHPTSTLDDHLVVGFTQGPPSQSPQLAAAFCTDESRPVEVASEGTLPDFLLLVSFIISSLRSMVLLV